MLEIKTIQKSDPDFPFLLRHIADPPKRLHVRGSIAPLLDTSAKILCVVGSRKYSEYGKLAVDKLISGLKGYNICIVSGLALGIDSLAHSAALKAGLYTAAFPGSGLDPSVIYPTYHRPLAQEILEAGGALISEFDMMQTSTKWTFPSRNRLMAGVSHATLVIEAGKISGTLITSKFATQYNRDVGAVPGQIFSPLSAGPHMLIRDGATPVTCVDDLLELLGFARRDGQSRLPLGENPRFKLLGEVEQKVLRFLEHGPRSKDALVRDLFIEPRDLSLILSSLELEGFIKEEDGLMRVV